MWDTSNYSHPIAATLEDVAQILGQPLERVVQAAETVEPYVRADGAPVWSVELVGVQLGVRQGHGGGGGRVRRREAARRRREARRVS